MAQTVARSRSHCPSFLLLLHLYCLQRVCCYHFVQRSNVSNWNYAVELWCFVICCFLCVLRTTLIVLCRIFAHFWHQCSSLAVFFSFLFVIGGVAAITKHLFSLPMFLLTLCFFASSAYFAASISAKCTLLSFFTRSLVNDDVLWFVFTLTLPTIRAFFSSQCIFSRNNQRFCVYILFMFLATPAPAITSMSSTT